MESRIDDARIDEDLMVSKLAERVADRMEARRWIETDHRGMRSWTRADGAAVVFSREPWPTPWVAVLHGPRTLTGFRTARDAKRAADAMLDGPTEQMEDIQHRDGTTHVPSNWSGKERNL